MRGFRRLLAYAGLRALMLWAQWTPRGLGIRCFGALGMLAYLLLRRDRSAAIENLRQAFPELSPREARSMARASFRALGRNCYDVMRFPRMSAADVDRICTVEGFDHLLREEARGRGCIGLMGHIGCWEMVGAFLVARGYRAHAIARAVRDERIDRLLCEMRRRLGVRVIPRGPRVIKAYKALRKGELVGILIDQDTRVEGHFVPFFGRLAHTPIGLAQLALRSGASILPVAAHLDENLKHRVTFLPAVPYDDLGDDENAVLRLTERCSRAIEDLIRLDPIQWVWFHRRWKTRPHESEPPGERARAAMASGVPR